MSSVGGIVQPPPTPQLYQVVRHPVQSVRVPFSLVVVAAGWPCWLPSVSALNLPMSGGYFPSRFHKFFPSVPKWSPPTKLMVGWSTTDAFLEYTSNSRALPSSVCLLLSGGVPFYNSVLPCLKEHPGPFIFAFDTKFEIVRQRQLSRGFKSLAAGCVSHKFQHVIVNHADFGGATNASHLIIFRGFSSAAFAPSQGIPRVLKHLLNSAVEGRFRSIDEPPPLQGSVARTPIVVEGLLRREGLFDVHNPTQSVACPSVFVRSGWVSRALTLKELLRTFDMPVSMDCLFGSGTSLPCGITHSISSLVVTSIFHGLWGSLRGVESSFPTENNKDISITNNNVSPQPLKHSHEDEIDDKNDDITMNINEGGIELVVDDSMASIQPAEVSLNATRESDNGFPLPDFVQGIDTPCSKTHSYLFEFSHIFELATPQDSSASLLIKQECNDTHFGDSIRSVSSLERLDRIKKEHDLAKAVKSDDAEVPIHLWDKRICRGKPTTTQVEKLAILRDFILQLYRRRTYLELKSFLRRKHGPSWFEPITKVNPNNKERSRDRAAARDLLWRVCNNDWFEYPYGSRLFYNRYPTKYRREARDGVKVYFTGPAPTKKKSQPTMPPEETKILRSKLLKMIKRRYIVPPEERLQSLIFYFGVPKGVLDGVVQDWRIVYHAGANKLNDAVWVPSFWLPRVDSLLRIVDFDSCMEDRDIGEMFLNFELDPFIRRFTGVDIGPLGISKDDCPVSWAHWNRNLMGFKSSPYNSIKMYLVTEEIIRGNREDKSNAFQWHTVLLNLPGSENYRPDVAWISKRREDGSLASDFVCFVDDQRLAAANKKRLAAAGHQLSSRESYMGIQDALRKLREGGSGAWAGAVVHITEEHGVIVLTSQDKWDRLKAIVAKWLDRLNAGENMLPHSELLSDRGFLVYVTQPYPAMVPYLKGVHLTLEMWRGGRDAEGWKLKPTPDSPSLSDEGRRLEVDAQEDAALLDEKTVAPPPKGPSSGLTQVVPRLKDDLLALQALTNSDKPRYRVVRSKTVFTAYYGFGDASSGGFGSTIERPGGIQGRFGLWGSDEESASSNYRELLNLVETVEEEANQGHLRDTELWLFTDNSTAESCFARGNSSSKKLHELIVRLRKVEMEAGLNLQLVHVAGTRMIAQGTDGLSRGVLLEGVLSGKDMLAYIDLSKTALERHPPLLEFLKSWIEDESLKVLKPEEWFVEGHGITGGNPDRHGVWIPSHAPKFRSYLWTPPPVIADVALEECLKAVHKRRDAYHIFAVPRLFTTKWRRLFAKLCDFSISLPVGSPHWPSHLHEPLWIGISFPFIPHRPWSIRGTPTVVGLERKLHQMLRSGETDGRDLLREFLRTTRRLQAMQERVACRVLRVPWEGSVSNGQGRGR